MWTQRRKAIVSACLIFHLFAVFAAPCASPPPSSYAWSWLAGRTQGRDGILMPYLRACYLNHGYRFFAPNPGPSHLIRYEIDVQGGGRIEGQFPDPAKQWPRLLYHRMFMVSETLFNLDDPVREPSPPGQRADFALREFHSQRACADALIHSVARHLLSKHKGQRIRLYLRTHEIPFPADVLAGQKLNDSRLYHERLLGEFSEDEL